MQLPATHPLRMFFKFMHLLSASVWTGGGMAVLVLLYDDRQTCSGDELFAYNHAIRSIDDYLIRPAAAGTLVSGTLLCFLSNWGVIRHRWIIVKWTVTLAAIAFGGICLGPWFRELAAFTGIDSLSAHEASGYLRLYHLGVMFGSLQTVVLLILVLISILKPDCRWGRKTVANPRGGTGGSGENSRQEPAGKRGRSVTRKLVPLATVLSAPISPP
jgi:hypothetical protein